MNQQGIEAVGGAGYLKEGPGEALVRRWQVVDAATQLVLNVVETAPAFREVVNDQIPA